MKLDRLRQVNQAAEQLALLRQAERADGIDILVGGKKLGALVFGPTRPAVQAAFRAALDAAIVETIADLAALGVEV